MLQVYPGPTVPFDMNDEAKSFKMYCKYLPPIFSTPTGPFMNDLAALQSALFKFRDDRNWKQFHTLKNLIASVSIEAAELLELTQWKTDDEMPAAKSDPVYRQALQEECADVLMYLLLVADEAGFDLLDAAAAKLKKNEQKYPVGLTYGSAKKYTKLAEE